MGLASGFDLNGDIYRELSAMGFGFVEIGTVTPRAQNGNPKPRIFRLPGDRAIVNRIGLSNRGLDRAIYNLRRPHEGVIVGCNIGKNTITPHDNAATDYLKLFRNLYQYVDYFTVNISYNTTSQEYSPSSREEITAILNPLFDFRRGQNQYRPILLKISPDLPDEQIDLMTDIMVDTPLDGIVAANATASRSGLGSTHEQIAACGPGAVSGAPLTRRSIDIVHRISERSHGAYPIIGVGGMMTPDDVRAMLDAGASLVQVYTGFIYGGPQFAGDICRALAEQPRPETPKAETASDGEEHRTDDEAAAPTAAETQTGPTSEK